MTINETNGNGVLEVAPAFTRTGVQLPIVALAQRELLTVRADDTPIVRNSLGPGIHFQPLRLDVEANEWVAIATFEPGASVPLHYHTGPAEVLTLQGRWYYLEYPDQPQTAHSYLYEPGGSVHTFICPADNTEDTVLFFRVHGANVNFTDDGQFHSILDATSGRALTDRLCAEQGIEEIRYITGGAAGFTV
ncbi:MAG TPA: 2,4'-dihydroxyacetophenone dioxygenase family protein [Mycobacterium sp.]